MGPRWPQRSRPHLVPQVLGKVGRLPAGQSAGLLRSPPGERREIIHTTEHSLKGHMSPVGVLPRLWHSHLPLLHLCYTWRLPPGRGHLYPRSAKGREMPGGCRGNWGWPTTETGPTVTGGLDQPLCLRGPGSPCMPRTSRTCARPRGTLGAGGGGHTHLQGGSLG
jgi:hypothetical protein